MSLSFATEFCINVAITAGISIMKIYKKEDLVIEHKADNSPLTIADRISNDIIVSALQKEYPTYAILSEEMYGEDCKSRIDNDYCFVVDPLDGTREFISRNGQFTVNIALCHKGNPAVGVIYVPATEEIYFAYEGGGAFYKSNWDAHPVKISVTDKLTELVLVGSRSHSTFKEECLRKQNAHLISDFISVGSSLKGCMVAGGIADVYYRFGPTWEWDTAAMQCIVEQSGGIVRQMNGITMTYNRINPRNEKGFFVVNRQENIWL